MAAAVALRAVVPMVIGMLAAGAGGYGYRFAERGLQGNDIGHAVRPTGSKRYAFQRGRGVIHFVAALVGVQGIRQRGGRHHITGGIADSARVA